MSVVSTLQNSMRLLTVGFFGLVLVMTAPGTSSAADLPRTSPEEAGFAADLAARTDKAAAEGILGNVHAVAAARDGRVFMERYYTGEDEHWGTPLGQVTFGPDVQHDLRSVSKTIVGLLYGIALEDGLVPSLPEPVLDHFPAYADLASEPGRREITIAHVLSMTMGLEWDESLPYSDPRNSEIAMELADDRYRFILSRPIVHKPGAKWTHSEHGEAVAASGLRMTLLDLVKIGQLTRQNGQWQGKQIVQAAWLNEATKPHADPPGPLSYGYHWWAGVGERSGKPFHMALGNGGKTLVVNPSMGMVVAFLAGEYNDPNAWQQAIAFSGQVLFPALERP